MRPFDSETATARETLRFYLYGITLALYSFYLAWSVAAGMGLFADGSHFFLKYVNQGTHPISETFRPACIDRGFAHLLQYGPLSIAARTFAWPLSALRRVLSATLILPPLGSLAACYVLAGAKRGWIVFPAVSAAVMMITHPFFLGEFQLLPVLAWPLAFLVAFADLSRLPLLFLSALCLLFLALVYEGSFPFLAAISLTAIALAVRKKRGKPHLGIGLFGCLACLVSIYGLSRTCYPEQLRNFLGISVQQTAGELRMQLVALMTTLFSLGLFARRWESRATLLLLGTGVSGALFLLPLFLEDYFRPQLSYFNRTIALFLFGVLLVLFLVLQLRERPRIPQGAGVLASLFLLGQAGYGFVTTYYWSKAVVQIRELSQARIGPISVAHTPLDLVSGDPRLSGFNWLWTLPALSLALSEDKEVKGLLYNPDELMNLVPRRNRIYDPRVEAKIPDLRSLGFRYERYQQALRDSRRQEPASR